MKRIRAVIEDVVQTPGKIAPILVNFPPGEAPSDLQDVDCGLFYNKIHKTSVLALDKDDILYRGSDMSENTAMTTVLAVYNEKSGTMKLVPAKVWNVSVAGNSENPYKIQRNENYAKENRELIEAFGSKKEKRKEALKYAINIDMGAFKEQLERSIKDIQLNDEDLTVTPTEKICEIKFPTINEEATDVKNVYNVYEILPKYLIESLQERAKDLLRDGYEVETPKDQYFANILESITKPKRKKKAAILIYLKIINDWILLKKSSATKLGFIEKRYSIPTDVAEHILKMYTTDTPKGRFRPLYMREKVLVDSLIMTVILCNYTIDFRDFNQHIWRTSAGKMRQYTKKLRLVPEKSDKMVYALKLPLPKEYEVTVKKGRF